MTRLNTLWRAEQGAAALEFALVAPLLSLLLIGTLQLGVLFQANAGLNHAVGEGARFATLYPSPTDAAIKTRVTNGKFGLQAERIVGPNVSRGVADGTKYVEVSMQYNVPLEFVFFEGPTVQLSETRRAFTP